MHLYMKIGASFDTTYYLTFYSVQPLSDIVNLNVAHKLPVSKTHKKEIKVQYLPGQPEWAPWMHKILPDQITAEPPAATAAISVWNQINSSLVSKMKFKYPFH